VGIKQEVTLEVFRCECRNCGKQSEIYRFSDFEYGRRLLRTEDGIDFGLEICYKDKVFEEVEKMVDSFYEGVDIPNFRELKLAEYFDKVFGLTCDPINGKKIDASKLPTCKYCGSSNKETFEYQPPRFIDLEVPLITHDLWEQKSESEKQIIINSALEKVCS
jgi:hypothetical protein